MTALTPMTWHRLREHPTKGLLDETERAKAAARACIKRQLRRAKETVSDPERWARENATRFELPLRRMFLASKRAYEGQTAENYEAAQLVERQRAHDLEAVCSALGVAVDWPGLAPCFRLEGESFDRYTIEDALRAVQARPGVSNGAQVVRRLFVDVRTWRRPSAGHHIFTSRVWINGQPVGVVCERDPGHGSQCVYETLRALESRGLLPELGANLYPNRWASDHGVELRDKETTVRRRKDL